MANGIVDPAPSGTLTNRAANARLGFGGVPIGREVLRQTGEVREKYTDPSSPGIPSGPGGQRGWIDVGSDAWRSLRGGQSGLVQRGRGMQEGGGGQGAVSSRVVERATGKGEQRTTTESLREKATKNKRDFFKPESTVFNKPANPSIFEHGSPADVAMSSLANPWSDVTPRSIGGNVDFSAETQRGAEDKYDKEGNRIYSGGRYLTGSDLKSSNLLGKGL